MLIKRQKFAVVKKGKGRQRKKRREKRPKERKKEDGREKFR